MKSPKSNRIVDIISVIDGAAVEAARAGEQGRVFAVVASEVEQAAAAARSMRGQADLLAQAVSVFKLAGQPPARKPQVRGTELFRPRIEPTVTR
jgi:methyl-accepting chemotaxis protein